MINDCDEAVDVLWVDFHGRERPWGTIAPGGRWATRTLRGHTWRVRQAAPQRGLVTQYTPLLAARSRLWVCGFDAPEDAIDGVTPMSPPDAGATAEDLVPRCAAATDERSAPRSCSPVSYEPSTMHFANDCADTAVRVLWLTMDCAEVQYAFVPAGERFELATYLGHRWRVRAAADDRWLRDFEIDAKAATSLACDCAPAEE